MNPRALVPVTGWTLVSDLNSQRELWLGKVRVVIGVPTILSKTGPPVTTGWGVGLGYPRQSSDSDP